MLCPRSASSGIREDFNGAGREEQGGMLCGEMLTQFLYSRCVKTKPIRTFYLLPFTFYSTGVLVIQREALLRLCEVLLVESHQFIAANLVDPCG